MFRQGQYIDLFLLNIYVLRHIYLTQAVLGKLEGILFPSLRNKHQ